MIFFFFTLGIRGLYSLNAWKKVTAETLSQMRSARLLTASPSTLGTWAECQCQSRRWCESSTRSTRRHPDRSQPPTRRSQGGWRARAARMLSPACWIQVRCKTSVSPADSSLDVRSNNLDSQEERFSLRWFLVRGCSPSCGGSGAAPECCARSPAQAAWRWGCCGTDSCSSGVGLEVVFHLRGGWTLVALLCLTKDNIDF